MNHNERWRSLSSEQLRTLQSWVGEFLTPDDHAEIEALIRRKDYEERERRSG